MHIDRYGVGTRLTRNTITVGHTSFDKITVPTPTQRRAFELINTPIPLTLQ
jgi:hypothetical protein